MNRYKLLTPGPLTTSHCVKQAMLEDRCTWDQDYKTLTQDIRSELLDIAKVSEKDYSVVLMQGSGSFGVEATLTSALKDTDKALFIVNGAYGQRMVDMANCMGLNYDVYELKYNQQPNMDVLNEMFTSETTHVVMVHCETTTGMLNPIDAVGQLCIKNKKSFILDAMSSFGGIEIDMVKNNISFLISSANKCIQGVPGFSFVIAKKKALEACKGNAKSLVLDLYDQWRVMAIDGKWRYTSPTHVVAAFSKALEELKIEGGVTKRAQRYVVNNTILRSGMASLGFEAFIKEAVQSPIITSFKYPNDAFDFQKFYDYVKDKGFILYPGKLTHEDTFRIGNIGEIYPSDMEELITIVRGYMEGENV